MTDTNLVRFRAAVAGALAHLESRREEVNDLNVFPVADGDTGDNMALTLRAVLDELDRLQGSDGERTIDEIGREEIVQSVARAALLGARGNSGVILSQLIRGAAEELVVAARPADRRDADRRRARERRRPRLRVGARAGRGHDPDGRARDGPPDRQPTSRTAPRTRGSGPATEPRRAGRGDRDALERAVEAGQESVKRGPELLAALRDAGVVDAGGYGLTIIFAGVVAALRGEEPPELDHYAPARDHPPRAQLRHLPLLHQLRRHRPAA